MRDGETLTFGEFDPTLPITITKENYDPTAPLPQADPFQGRDRQLYAVDPTGKNTRNGTVQLVNQYPTTLREDLEELQEMIQRVLARL